VFLDDLATTVKPKLFFCLSQTAFSVSLSNIYLIVKI